MKKVMLIGDSIRLGYQEKVAELLAGRAELLGPKDMVHLNPEGEDFCAQKVVNMIRAVSHDE